MANETFDLVVIGAGPGGYVAAIRAAQLGMKVAVVEKRATFGGTCLNVGCIPSKALLQSSHLFEEAGHDLAAHGIVLAPPKLDFAQLMKRKGEVVDATTKGVAFLFRKNKITSFQGTGRIDKAGAVSVLGDDGAVKDTLADQEHPDRLGLGSDAAARRRGRREEDRVVDRRARARRGAEAPGRGRRRHHRPRAGLGVAPARLAT